MPIRTATSDADGKERNGGEWKHRSQRKQEIFCVVAESRKDACGDFIFDSPLTLGTP